MPESRDASKLSAASGAKIGFDAGGRVLSVSPEAAASLGYDDPGQLDGAHLSTLIGEEAAITLVDRLLVAEESGLLGSEYDAEIEQGATVTFTRRDGSSISLETLVTPELGGGSLVLRQAPAPAGPAETITVEQAEIDVAATLRALVDRTRNTASLEEICDEFARELLSATGAEDLVIARSSNVSGMYEAVSHLTIYGDSSNGGSVDLPASLVPPRGAGPVHADSLEALALFDPAMISGNEITGAFMATRAELPDGAHLLVVASAPAATTWSAEAVLLAEAGALSLTSAVHSAELRNQLVAQSRARETVRQVGILASQDHDGHFLEAALRVIARRLPVSAISIHAADSVTGRCYVAATAGQGEDEYGDLAPAFDWELAGSLEQRVLKTGRPIFLSASSREMTGVPPDTIRRWRSQGLQAVAAIPLREAGEAVAVFIAGFTSDFREPAELFRLMESISPAVHLGVGLSGGGPGNGAVLEETTVEPGFISPKTLLALTRAATEAPDTPTLFASVTEWLLEVIPSSRVAWGTVDSHRKSYHRVYDYDPNSEGLSGGDEIQIEDDEFESLHLPALQVSEPGIPNRSQDTMRAAVMDGQKLMAVVTAWHREGEPFTTDDVAKLERINDFIAAPLARIRETEAEKESRRQYALVTLIGTQASQFHEPATAFRSLRPTIEKIIPHDRALFTETDSFSEMAVALYDSAASPNDPVRTTFPVSAFPSASIVDSGKPIALSLDAGNARDLFADYSSLLSIPVSATDGPPGFLLLLSNDTSGFTANHRELASALSDQLTGAQAGWHAYRSTREAARDLREVRKQLNLILESAPIAIISTDPDGVCTWLEGHGLETLDIQREEMIGRSVFELTGRMPELEDAIRQALRGAPATAITSLGSHSAEVWAQPVTSIDGKVKGVTLIGYDVSAQIRAKRLLAENRKLHGTLKERSRSISTVSHELRNQLTSIIAYTDVLSFGSDEKLDEQQSHALSVIQRTASKLDTMISDLLGLDYELELSDVDVTSFMKEIVDAQEPIFDSSKQKLALNLPEVVCTVRADHLRLSQVVTNLLSNASKYSPAEASVSVDVVISGDELKICVSDNGPGIPPDQVERVWESGIRLANSKTNSVRGSGLGLSIARKIVELHGGTATLESELGVGTRVTVTLPGLTVNEKIKPVDVTGSKQKNSSRSAKAKQAAGRPTRQQRSAI